MATDDVKRAGLAAAVLGLTVAINLLVLQGRHSGLIETSALAPRALQDVSQARRVSDLGPAMAVDASPVLVVPPRAALAPVTTNAAEITRGIKRELKTRG